MFFLRVTVREIPPATLLLLLATILVVPASASTNKSQKKSVVRWTEGSPGSGFSRTADGKYVYDLKGGDLEIAIAIDSQELEKVHHRPLPVFSVRLEAHYTGQKSFVLSPDYITLEFVNHYQVVNSALDPDELGARIQKDIDNLSDETAHNEREHPEKKQDQESLLQAHLKDMTDLLGFTSLYGLRGVTLDPGNSVAGGWIFFSTKSKWIGKWKPREEFVLRVPVNDNIFEFPFALPPNRGDLILRRRPS